MSLFHAVVWLDHHNAKIFQFDTEHVEAQKVKASSHHTRQHGAAVRDVHEFFADVCTAVSEVQEILIVGSSTVQSDFKHYVEKHRPHLGKQLVGYEAVDNPTDNQLIAMARQYFLKYDRMAGTPSPMGV